MMAQLRGLDGRLVACVIVALFFGVFSSVSFATGTPPWSSVGVGATKTQFIDLESITSSWDCERRGVEAFPLNPCDPYGRPANYPRLWTRLYRLGLKSGDLRVLGVLVGLIFYAAALLVPGPLTRFEGAVYGLLLISPVTLLGVERGNIDLLMFALVCAAVISARRIPWAAGAFITAAGVLKLFPIAALAMLLRPPRWAAVGASAAIFAVYAVLTRGDLDAILKAVPHTNIGDSYGADVLARSLWSARALGVRSPGTTRIAWVAIVMAGFAVALGLLALTVRQPRVGDARADRRLHAFLAGAVIYVATYVFGSNFDYRLVFLLLCVPQLCSWARGGAPVPFPAVLLSALVLTFALSSYAPPLLFGLKTQYVQLAVPPDEILNWVLFSWITAALVVTGVARNPSRANDRAGLVGS